jgi:hypothetical protein
MAAKKSESSENILHNGKNTAAGGFEKKLRVGYDILAPTCFGSSLPSPWSFLDPSELLEIQIEWVVYHIVCGYVACVPECRGSVCCDIPPNQFEFQVTQKDLRSCLMMAGYCRNM